MNNEEIKKHSILIHSRLPQKSLKKELENFARENGFHWAVVDKVWWGSKHDTEQDANGIECHTLACVTKFVTSLATLK